MKTGNLQILRSPQGVYLTSEHFLRKALSRSKEKILYAKNNIALTWIFQKRNMPQNNKHKDKPMTTILDWGQAHEKCGVVKLVQWVSNPSPTSSQMKKKQTQLQTNYKNQTESHQGSIYWHNRHPISKACLTLRSFQIFPLHIDITGIRFRRHAWLSGVSKIFKVLTKITRHISLH